MKKEFVKFFLKEMGEMNDYIDSKKRTARSHLG